MFARPGLCGMGIGRLGLVAASQPSLVAQALAILAKYGSAANLYLPGVGAISGITAGNWLDSAGTTAAAVDGQVGRVDNARGGANLTQSTAANRPILRLSGGVYAWDFVSSDSLASTLTPGNAGFLCSTANFADSSGIRAIVGCGAGSSSGTPGILFARNGANLTLFVSDGASRQSVAQACPTATSFVASSGWDSSSMFSGVGNTETSAVKTVNCATSVYQIAVGQLHAASQTAPMLGTIGATILMPTVLPTTTERATLRKFIAALSGVTL